MVVPRVGSDVGLRATLLTVLRPLDVVTPAAVVPRVESDVELRVVLLAVLHALRRGDQFPPPVLSADPSFHWLEAVAQWHMGPPASRPLGMAPTGYQPSLGCQAWHATSQVARGELAVTSLRSGAVRGTGVVCEADASLVREAGAVCEAGAALDALSPAVSPTVVVAVVDGDSHVGSQVSSHNTLFPRSPRQLGLKRGREDGLLQLCAPLVSSVPLVSELYGSAPSDPVVVLGDPASPCQYTLEGIEVHALAVGADPMQRLFAPWRVHG